MTRALSVLSVKAPSPEESADITAISSVLVLNIGTLTYEIIDEMILSVSYANEKKIM